MSLNFIKSFLKFVISALIMYFFYINLAFCCTQYDSEFEPVDISVVVPDVTVQRDAPVGTILYEKQESTNKDFYGRIASCGAEDYGLYSFYGGDEVVSNKDVYATSVPGVGITIASGDKTYIFSKNPQQIHYAGAWDWTYWGTHYVVVLIKVAEVTGSGDIGFSQGVMTLTGVNPNPMTITVTGGKVTTLACSVTNKNINVPLGDVAAKDFTSIGSSPKSVNFELGLNCDPNANINVTLQGNQNPDSSDTSVLSLSNQGQPGVADGVGVQLLHDDVPFKINELANLLRSDGGEVNLSIKARYIQTKSTVKAGSANATATLNVTYQ